MQCRFGRLALLLAAAAVAGCSDSDPDFNSTSAATVPNEWTRLAHDYASTYSNPAETTLTAANVGQLKLDWHFQTAGSANGAAAVADGVVYVLSTGGTYAFEAASGNVLWQNPEVAGTASPAYDHGALFIQMSNARLVALDATTGAERWRATVDANEFASGFSSPIVFERYVIVGSSSIEEAAARRNATFRGGLVAFDRDSGAEIWRFYTADPPYNGVGVWSTASIDTEARIVYGSTGNNYTESAGPTSDSIFALNVDTGALVWLTQLTEGDVFTILNPGSQDTDFGTNPILFEATIDGRQRKLLAAGQKSGVFWALDRESGEVVWSQAVSPGSALIGGFLNNGAYDGEHILAAGNNGSSSAPGSEEPVPPSTQRSRLVAFDPATGAIVWERQIGGWVWAPLTVANGVGYVAVDTTLQAFDARTGAKLFTFPTNGTITSAPVVADGRVYFGSGLSYFVGTRARDFYALSLEGGGGDHNGGNDGTTFRAIYTDIIVGQGCTTTSCHGSNQGNLRMSSRAEAYANLVSVAASGPLCEGIGLNRVEPGDPDHSLLYDKISQTQPACGTAMPPTGPLSAEDVARIRDWITRGAPDD